MRLILSFLLAIVPTLVYSQAATDEIQDADPAQSGYLNNHNLHPATVGSSVFGILWKNAYGAKEKWFAKPLLYTPTGHLQVVFLASSMNVIRIIDAVNGTLLNSRTVIPPFLQADIGCTDIPDYIGITGTPVIDPATNTAYFFAKGYKNEAESGGVINGLYKFYAVDVLTLADKPGFPVTIDGHYADNDATKYFMGGTILQRPSLTMVNGVVLGGFGGHCDLFNYTGMLVAVSTTANVGVTSIFAMEGGVGSPPATTDYTIQQGGRAGIWQSGMAVSTDGNGRVFLATGNGQGHQNGGVPASGRTPLDTLDEVVANFAISATGKITLTDYFEPYEYVAMDAGDRDLGSSGVSLLDPTAFYGTGVSRMAVTIGKNGKAYILNANNLGGFKQGSGGVDNILQTIIASNSVFGGVGSYPLEGGYLYFTPIGSATLAYKMGFDSSGAPLFTLVGQTATTGAGRVGIGIPTTTTYKGQAGTGILWVTDPTNGLQAFNAVPVNGVLNALSIPATGGLNKFIRPAFGDGRVYVSDSSGNVICLGSPVALPLACTQPIDFGDLTIGSTKTMTATCTALIAITAIVGCITGEVEFQCSNSTLPKGALAKGATFSFPVIWNLTQASINNDPSASSGKVLPGVASTNLNILTTNAVAGYSSVLPVSLTGNTVSVNPYLIVTPQEVDMGGLVVGSAGATSGLSSAMTVQNVGATTLAFLGSSWSSNSGAGPHTNITNGVFGAGFTSSSFPKVGATLAPGASLTIPIQFLATQVGAYSTFVEFWTNGGKEDVLLTASAATAQVASISTSSTTNGPWDSTQPSALTFRDVQTGTTVSKYIRICNTGGSPLTVSKSKPPIDAELLAPNAGTQLYEGQIIQINSCALGQVSIVAAPLGVNRFAHIVSDTWTLNTDDVTFGVHEVAVSANIVTRQVGPLLANGSSEYLYLGCYWDGGGRLLNKAYNPNNNENGICQTTCLENGYMFAGTEYQTECWCGITAPTAATYTPESSKLCSFSCPGDTTQACGGTGTYISIYYDRTKYVPGPDSIPGASSASVAPTSSKFVTSTTSTKLSSTTSSSKLPTSSPSSSTKISSSSSKAASTSSSTQLSSTSTKVPSSTTSSKPSTSSSKLSSSTSKSSSSTKTRTSTLKPSSSSTKTTATPTPTGPTIVQSAGAYHYVGCFTESTTGRALDGLIYADDNMTIEICAAKCAAFSWFGVEYARECYCGNAPNAGSVLSTTGNLCDFTCMANNWEYCGGSSRLSMYNNLSAGKGNAGVAGAASNKGSRSSSSKLSSTTSKVCSPSFSSKPGKFGVAVGGKATLATTPPSTSLSRKSSASSSLPTSNSSPYLGCYSDPAGGPFNGHNLPVLFASDLMTPELCISSALAALKNVPATTYLFAGVEYGRECYAGTAAPTPQPMSYLGFNACTMTCLGDGGKGCGGPNMYNLYAVTTAKVRGTRIGQWQAVVVTATP